MRSRQRVMSCIRLSRPFVASFTKSTGQRICRESLPHVASCHKFAAPLLLGTHRSRLRRLSMPRNGSGQTFGTSANCDASHNFSSSVRYRTDGPPDRKSTRLNSSHVEISYAVFCLKKKKVPCKLQFRLRDRKEMARGPAA